jgi:hypothetical protein
MPVPAIKKKEKKRKENLLLDTMGGCFHLTARVRVKSGIAGVWVLKPAEARCA